MKKYLTLTLLSLTLIPAISSASLGDVIAAPIEVAADTTAATVDTGLDIAEAGTDIAADAVVTAADIATAPFQQNVVYEEVYDGYDN